MLRRTGAAAPPFGVPRNRPMPFRVPGTHTGRRAPTEVASDSGKVPRQRGRRQHEVPPLRQRGIGKTSTDKTSARQAAGKHQQDKPPTARESPAAQRMRRRDEGIGSEGATGGPSPASRRSAAHEPPAAREPPQQASLLEHEGHQQNAIYRANSARQARRTPQDSARAKSILNSRGSLSAFRRAGPVQGWPNSGLAQALKTRRARLRKPSRLLEELAEFRTG